MTEKNYEQISRPFREKPALFKSLVLFNKLITLLGYVSYPAMILMLLIQKDLHAISYVLIPGISFVALSLYRDQRNKPRPYEALAIDPLIKKDTKGHSFPSRHIFSIFLIAACWFSLNMTIGIILMIFGLFLAVIRVIGGVHYPIDVCVGVLVGIVCGFATYLSCMLY